jgi:hypothetical protein
MGAQGRYRAWLLLCGGLAAHIADEAYTGFLGLYNPTVLAIRERMPWLMLPTFTFPVWISLLIFGVIGLLILSHWVKRGLHWTVYASYAFASVMLANGVAHLGFSVYTGRWMSGAYTSPLVLAAAANLMLQTSVSARRPACSSG